MSKGALTLKNSVILNAVWKSVFKTTAVKT